MGRKPLTPIGINVPTHVAEFPTQHQAIDQKAKFVPELPEVETMRRGVLPVVGAQIVDVEFVRSKYKPILVEPRPSTFRRRLVDAKIVDVGRIGKRVLIHLESGDAIVFEPRMTGLLLLADPPNQTHLRVHFHLRGPVSDIWFWDRRGLGTVRLLSPQQQTQRLGPDQLGPDALVVTSEVLQERLGSSRRPIKVALLDQRRLAGVGNLYASELLHVAGVHPERSCARLTNKQWQAITEAMQMVLQEAIKYEGSTLADGTYRNALNQSGGYQNCHRVYGKADTPCPRCRATIKRIVQSQRSTFFCPRCQRKR